LLQPFPRTADEIPPDRTLALERVATNKHDLRLRFGGNGSGRAPGKHHEDAMVGELLADSDRAVNDVQAEFLCLG
jgi:hypothetical protein